MVFKLIFLVAVNWFPISYYFAFVPWFRASTLSSAVSSLANTGISFTKVDEREKQAALEEEQARLKALKVHLPHTPITLSSLYFTELQEVL